MSRRVSVKEHQNSESSSQGRSYRSLRNSRKSWVPLVCEPGGRRGRLRVLDIIFDALATQRHAHTFLSEVPAVVVRTESRAYELATFYWLYLAFSNIIKLSPTSSNFLKLPQTSPNLLEPSPTCSIFLKLHRISSNRGSTCSSRKLLTVRECLTIREGSRLLEEVGERSEEAWRKFEKVGES